MITFQWIFIPVLSFLFVGAAIQFIKVPRNRRPAGLATLIFGGAAVLVAFPEIAVIAARATGIGRGTDLVVYVAVFAGAWSGLALYARSRRLEIALTRVVRELALERAAASGDPEEERFERRPEGSHTKAKPGSED